MPTLAIDAACLAELWSKDGKIYFDLGGVAVISDPDDMYTFDKNNHFTLREDL